MPENVDIILIPKRRDGLAKLGDADAKPSVEELFAKAIAFEHGHDLPAAAQDTAEQWPPAYPSLHVSPVWLEARETPGL